MTDPHRGHLRPHHPRQRNATSVDVAAEAGVSQATVARTFSHPDRVAEETKQRVHEAADRIGYVPNAIARSLKSQRTNIVGIVVPGKGEYWQSVVTKISQRLANHGRQLLIFSFTDQNDVNQVLDSVRQYRLDALVMASSDLNHFQLAAMAATDQPVVAFNQPAADSLLPSVTVDNQAGMTAIAEHVVATGVSTVAYVGGVSTASTDQIRYQAAAKTLGRHGLACPYHEAGAFTYEAGFATGVELARNSKTRRLPEAIMVAADEVAFGLIDGLRTAGVGVPNDVLVTGFDGLPQASWAPYDLTTVVQPTSELVDRTIDLLINPNQDPATNAEPTTVVIQGTLRIGSSSTRPTS